MVKPYDDPRLAAFFPEPVWTRGQEYLAQRRIAAIEPDEGGAGWEGRVQGSRTRPYHVWVDIRTVGGVPSLEGGCMCPAPDPCKHLAAVVMALADLDESQLSGAESNVAALREWVDGVAQPKPAPTAKRKSNRALLYVLQIRPPQAGAPATLTIDAVNANLRKDGSFGATRPVDLKRFLYRPSDVHYISETDRLLWFRLHDLGARQGGPAWQSVPRSAEGTELLHDFIATGRCFFREVGRTPLINGAARGGEVRWICDNDGRQRLAVLPTDDSDATAEFSVLPVSPPHYVDVTTNEIGPMALDIPEQLSDAIVDVPVLPAEAVADLPAELVRKLEDLGLPPPKARPVRRFAADLHPRLVLQVRNNGGANADAFDHAHATLEFHYGEHVVVHGETKREVTLTRVMDDEIVKIARDLPRESAQLQRLHAAGFVDERIDGDTRLTIASRTRWLAVCGDLVPELREEGWSVDIDETFPFEVVESGEWYLDLGGDEATRADWFSLEVGVEVEGERVNLLPVVVAALRSGALERDRIRVQGQTVPLPLGDGRWVSLPAERLATVLDSLVELFDDRLTGDRLQIAKADSGRLLALEGLQWHGDANLRKLAEQLALRTDLPPIPVPEDLGATLRDYQQHGLDWLGFLREHGFGGVLADDMGLGKTVQALAHLLAEKHAGRLDRPCLVVAPRTVIHNWARECERFAPTLSHAVYHGPERHGLFDAELPNLVITTYAILQRDPALQQQAWHAVVLDEAQVIKNPRTKAAVVARKLEARQRLCLTGTPMENNLEELWSLFAFVAPGLLGGHDSFSRHYRRPIERQGDGDRLAALSARIAPFMLRRTKAQVLSELPPKTEVLLTVPFSARQRDLYESVRMAMEKRVRTALHERGLAKSHIVVLDALLKLRQVCCHPTLVKTEAARKANAGSAKTERLLELLTELLAQGRRTIVFSQFTSMLAIVATELEARGITFSQITGRTKKRQPIVDAFQAGEFPVLLISLKAGGTGINLTAADTVIHYDPWWNPAVEEQATDRAHRIGQTRPITVYRLVCEGTVEQRVLALQDRKRTLTRALQRDAEQRSSSGLQLDPTDLDLLLAPQTD